MSLEVCIPVSDQRKNAILKREWDEHIKKIAQTPTKDVFGRYDQLGQVGKILKEYLQRENKVRTNAFANHDISNFFKTFIKVAKMRAKEMGYRYEDVEVSADSGITGDGKLLVKFVPKDGVERISIG